MTRTESNINECAYSHDVDSDLFSDIAGKTWSCPHEYTDSDDYCPIHRPSASPQKVRSFILDACEYNEAGPQGTQFFGAECDILKLDHVVLEGSELFPVDLRDGTFEEVSIEKSRIGRPITLAGARIQESLNCEQTVFERDFEMRDAVVSGDASFEFARFKDRCTVSDAEFDGKTSFNAAVFSRGIIAIDVKFADYSEFVNTNFEEMANFRKATFVERVDFDGPEFFLDARFDQSVFKGPAFFETTKFHQVGVFRDVIFEGPVSFRNCLCVGRASFQSASFDDTALFPGIEFRSITTFSGVEFCGGINLRRASISEIKFEPSIIESVEEAINFTGAHLEGGILRLPDSDASVIRLTNATLGNVELRSDKTEFVLDAFILKDVQYEGFSFDRLENELRNSGGHPELVRCGRDHTRWQSVLSILPGGQQQHQLKSESGSDNLKSSILERTYRKAKNGANRAGEPKASSYFFRKEMSYRRKRHWETVQDPEIPGVRRLTAGFRWVANAVLYVTAGYGERPSWTIVSSILSILLFAGAYVVLGVYTGNARTVESLLFSTQSFVTFIVGEGPEAVGFSLRALSVLQGFVGAFLVAVFVFTLTRTVYR